MRGFILIVAFWFSIADTNAEEISAIVSQSKAILTIKDVDRVQFEMFKTVKILSEKGNYHSRLSFYVDDYRRGMIYNVTVKDANGKVAARYNMKDFRKTAVIESIRTYGNVYRFHLDCALKTYPYSVEVHSMIEKNRFFEMGYDLSADEGTSLEQSSLEVYYPIDYKFTYQLKRPDLVLVDSIRRQKNNVFKFSLKESFMSTAEPFMPESDRPIVYIIPEIFKFGNVTGSFNSWQEYGQWINELWMGRNELSKSSAEAIDKLIAGNPVKDDLVKAIYKYTQQNMRYVSITLGLGGLQTMSAKETAKMGYGDCKALSNFTAAAMNYAGIEAYPALVYGGSKSLKIDPETPRFSFNHVIVCLPANGDTTWLECTDNTVPFGYMSDFTDDRHALIIKPSGGILAKTPSFSTYDNATVRKSIITLYGNGSAEIELNCGYSNLAMSKSAFYRREITGDKPVNAVKSEVVLASFDLESYSAELYKNQEPILDVKCSIMARNVGRKVGDKLLIKPFFLETNIPTLKSDSVRVNPVYFKHGYTYLDTISVILPVGMSILEPLKKVDETSEFGQVSLHSSWNEAERKIEIVRSLRLNNGEYQTEQYAELTSFLNLLKASEELFFILQ